MSYGVWITREDNDSWWLLDNNGFVFHAESFVVALAQAETVKKLNIMRAVDANVEAFGPNGQPAE